MVCWAPVTRRAASSLPPLLLLLGPCLGLAGCVSGSMALWRAGARQAPGVELPAPRAARDVSVHLKAGFGWREEIEARRSWMCGTTQVLRRAFLLDPAPGDPPPPEGPVEELGWVTTEEFPRDEARSRILGPDVLTVFGMGTDPFDLFEVQLDPGFRGEALERLRELGAALGADAVVDVYATGEAEHHMYLGSLVSLDLSSTRSPIYSHLSLLDFTLRDVRLHGTAVRRAR